MSVNRYDERKTLVARRAESERMPLLVTPLIVGMALALIANIDSPRGGVIRVQPQSLIALAESLKARLRRDRRPGAG